MTEEKDVGIAYLLWLFLGIFGAHKLYLGRPGMALLYLCTAGLVLIGWIIDLFTLRDQVWDYNESLPLLSEEREALVDRIEDLEDEIDYLRDELRRKS